MSLPRLPAVLLCACALGCTERPRADAPNLVLIVVDTLRADMVVGGRATTPSIDRLAADGIPFPSAFCHAPMTLPAHTALFASRLPHETGVLRNTDRVPRDLPLLAEHLRELGFRTGAIISLGTLWHRGGQRPALERGFEHYEHAPGPIAPADSVFAALQPLVAELAGDPPFFLFAHFSDPHEPYNAHGLEDKRARILLDGEPLAEVSTADMTYWGERSIELAPGKHVFEIRSDEAFSLRSFRVRRRGRELPLAFLEGEMRGRSDVVRIEVEQGGWWSSDVGVELWIADHAGDRATPRYTREVEFADAHVGRLLDDLRRRGLYDESLIVFTSDHGETLDEPRERGHVHHLHDELVHVPLILKPPAAARAEAERLAAIRAGLVRHLDVVPTLLDLMGLAPLVGQRGRSLLREEPAPDVVAETHAPESVRNLVAIRDLERKLVYHPDEDRFALFDLVADPGELHGRGADVPDRPSGAPDGWEERLRGAWRGSRAHRVEVDLSADELERMRALGYFE